MPPERRVLVVDDDVDILDMLAGFLVEEGYQVKTALHGGEALTVASSWRPDLILLDMMMPVVDGRAFLAMQQSDADLARVPVIAMSASSELLTQGQDLRAAALVPKPFDIDHLLTNVDKLTA